MNNIHPIRPGISPQPRNPWLVVRPVARVPLRPAGQATDPAPSAWKVLAVVFGGILAYEAVSYYWNREKGRYARRNPAKIFRVVEHGVYLGTFRGETYAQARFAAEQYYWTHEYVTLAEKAAEIEKRRPKRNPARAKRTKYEVFADDGYRQTFVYGEHHLKTNSLEEAQEFAQRFMKNHPRGRVPLPHDSNTGGRVWIEHKFRDGDWELVAKWVPDGNGWKKV